MGSFDFLPRKTGGQSDGGICGNPAQGGISLRSTEAEDSGTVKHRAFL